MKHNDNTTVPAFAITTSNLPAMDLISLMAASLSSLSQDVSLTICTFPGNSFVSACRAVAADGFRAPAKTVALSRWARAVTSPRPNDECQHWNHVLNGNHAKIPMPRFAPETR